MKRLLAKFPLVLPVIITFFTFIGGAVLNQSMHLLDVAKLMIIINIAAYLSAMFFALWFIIKHAHDKLYSGFMACAALSVLLMAGMTIGDILWFTEEYSHMTVSIELNLIWSVFELFTAVLIALMVYSFEGCPRECRGRWNGVERRITNDEKNPND